MRAPANYLPISVNAVVESFELRKNPFDFS